MRKMTTLRLAVLAGLTQSLVACGGAGTVPAAKQDTQTDWRVPIQEDAADKEAPKEKKLTDADFQVRNIEEVKAPRYLLGIEHAAQDLFRQGIVAVVAVPPRYKLAQEKFQAAVDSDSKFMEAYFNLGMTLERQGKSEEALDVYKDALDASPDDVSAQAYIAKIYLGKARRAALLGDTGDYNEWLEKTKVLLDKLAPTEPENVAVNNGLALYWLLQGDVETASKRVKDVLYVEPRNVTGLNTRGLINLKQGNFLVAEWIFKNKVLSEDPNSTEALTNLGYTYIKLNQRPLAMRYFKQALTQDAENMEVRMNIAAMLLEHLNYAEAQTHYAKVYNAQPLNMEALEGLCDATYALGGGAADSKVQFQKGIDCYLEFISKRPERSLLYKRIAETYQHKMQNLEKAVEYYEVYFAKGTLDAKEKKAIEGAIAQLKDIIARGGLKAMLPSEDDLPPMDDDFEEIDDEGEGDGDGEGDGEGESDGDEGGEDAPADGESVPQA